jgi:bifunctional enzyme CysN/CysC
LLYECGALFDDQVKSVQGRSADGEIDFSLFTDGLKAEREQGITIDVAYRYFATPARQIIVADTPGHVQYTRNMATGASTADACVILVDARLGVLPQTRRHAFIAGLLGIPYLAVAINKIDLVHDERAVFERLQREVKELVSGLGFAGVEAFPVSARRGDNIVTPSPRTPWHQGGTLLSWLEALPHAARQLNAPFRFAVQSVLRPDLDYRALLGTIASGQIAVGDEVVVLPSGRTTRVAAIDTFDGPLPRAQAPQAVALRLQDEVDASRGDLLAHPDSAPRARDVVEADVVWFSEQPLVPGARVLLKHTTRLVNAEAELLLHKIDLADLSAVPATELSQNDIGRVRLVTRRPLLADAYVDNRATGAFILIDPLSNDTLGAGMIGAFAAGATADDHAVSPVSALARAARFGHSGAVVIANGSAHDAAALEGALFERGLTTALVVDDVDLAAGLARAGLVVVLRSRKDPRPALRSLHADIALADPAAVEVNAAADGLARAFASPASSDPAIAGPRS